MKTERIVVFALVALLVFVAIYLTVTSSTKTQIEDMEKISYTVGAEEGFYAIACKYCPDDMDRWEYINLVRELNGFDTKYELTSGERIVVYALPSDK